MRHDKILLFLVAVLAAWLVGTGCHSNPSYDEGDIGEGGDSDTGSVPAFSSAAFDGKSLILSFDEPVSASLTSGKDMRADFESALSVTSDGDEVPVALHWGPEGAYVAVGGPYIPCKITSVSAGEASADLVLLRLSATIVGVVGEGLVHAVE